MLAVVVVAVVAQCSPISDCSDLGQVATMTAGCPMWFSRPAARSHAPQSFHCTFRQRALSSDCSNGGTDSLASLTAAS
eukprot:1338885-Karenia_brevis.AAC.1